MFQTCNVQGTRFLLSDDVAHIDCLDITRLHPVRIAAKVRNNTVRDDRLVSKYPIRVSAKTSNYQALKNYEIPEEHVLNCIEEHVLNYLRAGYDTEMFRLSSPSDQVIILHWTELKDSPNSPAKERAKLVRDEPVYSFE